MLCLLSNLLYCQVKSNAVRALGNLSRFVNFEQKSNGNITFMISSYISILISQLHIGYMMDFVRGYRLA